MQLENDNKLTREANKNLLNIPKREDDKNKIVQFGPEYNLMHMYDIPVDGFSLISVTREKCN